MRTSVCLYLLLQATVSVPTEMVALPATGSDGRGNTIAGLTVAECHKAGGTR